MSWEFWGMVTGLTIMLGSLFFAVALPCWRATGHPETGRSGDEPIEPKKEGYLRAA